MLITNLLFIIINQNCFRIFKFKLRVPIAKQAKAALILSKLLISKASLALILKVKLGLLENVFLFTLVAPLTKESKGGPHRATVKR